MLLQKVSSTSRRGATPREVGVVGADAGGDHQLTVGRLAKRYAVM